MMLSWTTPASMGHMCVNSSIIQSPIERLVYSPVAQPTFSRNRHSDSDWLDSRRLASIKDERVTKHLDPCKPFASSYSNWRFCTNTGSIQWGSNIGASHRPDASRIRWPSVDPYDHSNHVAIISATMLSHPSGQNTSRSDVISSDVVVVSGR